MSPPGPPATVMLWLLLLRGLLAGSEQDVSECPSASQENDEEDMVCCFNNSTEVGMFFILTRFNYLQKKKQK